MFTKTYPKATLEVRCISNSKFRVMILDKQDKQVTPSEEYNGCFWRKPKRWDIFLGKYKNDLGINSFSQEEANQLSLELDDAYTKLKAGDKENDESKDSILCVSSIEANGTLYQEVWDGTKAKFVGYKNGKFLEVDQVNTEERIYVPIVDDALREGAVILPEKPVDFLSAEILAKKIYDHIHKYLDVSSDWNLFASYYIMTSWVADKMDTLSYLRLQGDTGTGKTRGLDVIGNLLYIPIISSGSVTPAPLYRMLKKWKGGSLIIDEADFNDSSEKNEVIKILNCGFQKGKPVIRCATDDPENIQIFPTFGTKMIATRFSFFDKALESRCITEHMHQTTRTDIPSKLGEEYREEARELRNQLLAFRFAFRNKIDPDYYLDLKKEGIEPRLEQAASCFSVLFAQIPEVVDEFKQFIKKRQKELIEERSQTYEGIITAALFDLIEEKKEEISSSDIVSKLAERGLDLSSQKVGKFLKALGLEVHNVRPKEGRRKRLINLKDAELLASLRNRYIPSEDSEQSEEEKPPEKPKPSEDSEENLPPNLAEGKQESLNQSLEHMEQVEQSLEGEAKTCSNDDQVTSVEHVVIPPICNVPNVPHVPLKHLRSECKDSHVEELRKGFYTCVNCNADYAIPVKEASQ